MQLDHPGLWAETAPAEQATSPLQSETRADIAIVGAGYTGLSAAYHAARAGAEVVVLDAQGVGAGGSGRNVGLVNAGLWIMPDACEACLSPGNPLPGLLADAPRAVWELIANHDIACEARPVGTLHCAPNGSGAAALAERHAQWGKRQIHLDLLDADETRARTGTDAFHAALFDPRAGTLQPLAYARGLARIAQAAGARLYAPNLVVSSTRQDGAWQLVTENGARVTAERVIWAGNAYGTGPAAVPGLAILPYFNFATDPLPEDLRASILPGGEGAWDTADVLTSFRLDAAGRFILGSVGALGGLDSATHEAWALRKMVRLFPQLKGQRFRHRWFGRIGTTPDAVPRLVAPGEGAFGLAGYNGRGIAPGTVLGKVLAEHALGQRTLPQLQPVAPEPLARMRGIGYRLGAAALHLVQGRI